ncbi:MAG TPA: valine--tRNA ligase [Tepidisphaeraceae bacterium]|jgi:valyl-tRNA synthetase|nr:valine--tRNA ligase [Tepidisphaeraceae bacterium]
MNTELSSKYDPSAVEAQAYQVWLEEKCFAADPAGPGEPYCIVIPPPNVTGALHLGHAINATLQDILIRVHRMMGFNTLWVPGIDHAGIATQAVVEKQLKEQENKTRHDVGREGLVERIWQWKQQYGDRILEQLKRLGASCDWDRTRFTLDDMCAKAVRETFFKLFKDGLIYRGKRLVHWDTFLQTSISDDEIYHETVKTFLWHIRYPIEDDLTPSPGTPGEGGGGGLPGDQRKDPHPTPPPAHRARGQDSTANKGTGLVGSAPRTVSPHGQEMVRNADPTATIRSDVDPAAFDEDGKAPPRANYMIVATTRPETMLGDTAVAVHSQDPRWNWAIGKYIRLPLTNRLIPIIADDILVDPKFGTGVVKVTPAHDPNDYAVWQRHKGQPDEIDLINILTPDGKIGSDRPEWSKYAGMKRNAARAQVVEDLKSAGLLEKEEPYETQVGHSDRSKTPVEPYLSDQWFVKMAPLAEPALQAVREGKIKFHPERHAQQYLSWLGEKRDWPVSRQLWWGHRIPVWTKSWASDASPDLPYLVPEDKSTEPRVIDLRVGGQKLILVKKRDDRTVTHYIGVGACDNESPAVLEKAGFVQDPDVLDTWFSSALWPHSTLGWPEQTAELAKFYPTSVLLTGRDIITLWVARMVMMGMYNMGDKEAVDALTPSPGTPGEGRGGGLVADKQNDPHPNPPPAYRERGQESARRAEALALGLPFLDVAINPTILDGKGERMSKSKGNGVDPVDIIDSYGADALRFTLTKMATETQDARMPVKRDANGKNTSDKFDEGRNFCNKLWNACRFALSNLENVASASRAVPPPLENSVRDADLTYTLVDRWIIARFNRTLTTCDEAIKSYRFDVYAKSCYDFFWGDFCDWYVEAIKPAMKDPARSVQTAEVLAAVLDGALRLMHPMIPFITETVWWRLNEVRPRRGIPGRIECPPSKRLVLAKWPLATSTDASAEEDFPKLQAVISAIRTIRNDYQVNPKVTVDVFIKADDDACGKILSSRELVEMLAICSLKDARADLAPIQNAVTANVAGYEIFVTGLIDPNAEKTRLAKEIETKEKSVSSMKARLGNEAYIAKAPPHLVQQSRDQLAAAETEVIKLKESLKKLE